MREQIADLRLFETHVKNLFGALPDAVEPGDWTPTFDMQPLLERFTMDTATEFLFGESVHSQKDSSTDMSTLFSKKEMVHFVDAFFAAEKTTAKSLIYGDLFWLTHDRKFKEQCKVVHKFVDTYVQRHLRDDCSDKRPGTGKYVVLDAIVADVKDPQELRSQLLNILLAGSDTISGTLGFLLASLAQYPHIFKKLRNIILDDFRSFNRPKQITLSGLKNCSYLQWCLKEVLRVYPSVPVNFREAIRDTILPVGGGADGASPVLIPKGHLVAWEVRFPSLHHYWASSCSSVLTPLSCSSGHCTQTQNSGALVLTASFRNDGKIANLDSNIFLSTLVLEYVSDSNSPLLRLPMSQSGSCKSSTQLMDQPCRRDDCPVIGNWWIKWPGA